MRVVTNIQELTVSQENQSMSVRIDGHFAILKMRSKGVFNPTSLEDFNQILDQVEDDELVQALLITGDDKNFSQGLDLEYLQTLEPAEFMQFVENTMVMVSRLLAFPVPVVSVVNGHAFGLGAMIALAGDYRVMRQDRGYLCLPEIDLKMGFTPAMNALVVNKLDGNLRRDMMLTGRRLSGEEAYSLGLFDGCASSEGLLDLAKKVVEPGLGKHRKSMASIKRGLNLPIISIVEAGSGVRGDK